MLICKQINMEMATLKGGIVGQRTRAELRKAR